MTAKELQNFFDFIKRHWEVYGPKENRQDAKKAEIFIEPLNEFSQLTLAPGVPFYSFKIFFVPEYETLFEYKNQQLIAKKKSDTTACPERSQTALFGVNILDLKAILLYDQVFEKDPYYQARRQNILVVGHSFIPDTSQNIFEQTFEEDILEHLSFDIFLTDSSKQKTANSETEYGVFTGSSLGQKILDEFGYDDYIHIQFSGPVKEGKLDERMLKLKDKFKNHHNQKIWDELGARCIECGKCTINCPTCFCFRINDRAELKDNQGQRQRCWDSCYYQEFSEVAGGHKFLDSTAKRIHFWYYHKFARIPDEFDFMGCVGCRRCAAVCPVGIDISEVLKSIEEL